MTEAHLAHSALVGLHGEVLDHQLPRSHARNRDRALHHRRDDLRNESGALERQRSTWRSVTRHRVVMHAIVAERSTTGVMIGAVKTKGGFSVGAPLKSCPALGCGHAHGPNGALHNQA